MLISIHSKIKFRKRALSYDNVFLKQSYPAQHETTIQISTFTVMMLVAGFSNHRALCVLTLCGILFLTIFTSYMYKYFGPYFKLVITTKCQQFKESICLKWREFKQYVVLWLMIISKAEYELLKLTNICCTINQIVFFLICERVLICQQNLTALYSLMFYHIVGYCFLYVNQLVENHNFSLYINIGSHSNIKHLAASATKIVLEWTKVIIFTITIVFLLFVICMEYRLHYFQPNSYYTICTWIYYLATEKIFAQFFPNMLAFLHISKFEDLESLWAPILLTMLTQILSFIFALILLLYGAYKGAILALYVNVYLSYKQLTNESLKTLTQQQTLISQFRSASKLELKEFADVCAVCLTNMNTARITPCHHFFHTDCLLKCLESSNICPMCKRELVFYYSQ